MADFHTGRCPSIPGSGNRYPLCKAVSARRSTSTCTLRSHCLAFSGHSVVVSPASARRFITQIADIREVLHEEERTLSELARQPRRSGVLIHEFKV
ncbi:MAG: hypothetical protein GWP39_01365 [Planctomycetia bacterium]|nr:hypothetical protein [Planctomycetia bacterium]NCG13908.1 hypothetical protein [Planctomycetia bacterium]